MYANRLIRCLLHAILPRMIVVTTETIPGQEITAVHGIVEGNSVRTRHVGRDVVQDFQNVMGGELTSHTEMLAEARKDALDRMIKQAESLDANAVISVRFATSAVTASVAEIYVYGTAVSVRPFQ